MMPPCRPQPPAPPEAEAATPSAMARPARGTEAASGRRRCTVRPPPLRDVYFRAWRAGARGTGGERERGGAAPRGGVARGLAGGRGSSLGAELGRVRGSLGGARASGRRRATSCTCCEGLGGGVLSFPGSKARRTETQVPLFPRYKQSDRETTNKNQRTHTF